MNNVNRQLDLKINTYKSDVYKFLEKTSLKAHVIFADPPYNFEVTRFLTILALVFERDLLKEGGVLIIEHSKHTDLSEHPRFSYAKKYGGNVFSFFEAETE